MKNLLRSLSILAALSLGAFAFATDKKAETKAESCCKADATSCCKAEKADKPACCAAGKADKAEKKDDKKPSGK
jgi:hypothetical protein